MASSKGNRWTSQSLEAWIHRTASMNITARMHFPEVGENNRRLEAECKYYHQKLQRIPSQWIETMGRMNVDVLGDFARCVSRLADMVEVDSPAWSKATFSVETVEFLADYYIWEHIHLDGQQISNHSSINDPPFNRPGSRGTGEMHNSNVEAVESRVEYCTREHVHLDGQQTLNYIPINDPMSNRSDSRGTDKLHDSRGKGSRIYPDQIVEADITSSGSGVDTAQGTV